MRSPLIGTQALEAESTGTGSENLAKETLFLLYLRITIMFLLFMFKVLFEKYIKMQLRMCPMNNAP